MTRIIELDALGAETCERLAAELNDTPGPAVGIATGPVPAHARGVVEALTVTLAPSGPGRSWVRPADGDLETLLAAVRAHPVAARVCADHLRSPVPRNTYDALVAESTAYSMLLGGAEFAAWRAAHPARTVSDTADARVDLDREGDRLRIRLTRPGRRNAYDHHMRDALVEALQVPLLDPTVATVELSGAGPDFCSGGDLDEFGSATDTAQAHLIRMTQSPALLLDRLRDRLIARVHGACVGSGIEMPAFAGRVVAAPTAWFALPELSMGLLPGAGGTVSITRRIGRWRMAYLVLTGRRIDAAIARAWGLVDEIG